MENSMLRIVSVLLLGSLALANGEEDPKSQRSGEFNRYFLYTRTQTGHEITASSTGSFLNTRKTVVIVHGHGGSYQTSLNPYLITVLYRSEEDLNIISLDWSVYAGLSYPIAEAAVPSVGLHLANFLVAISAKPELTHLIGFNLGAHIVGFTGRIMSGIARITGLDPSKTYKTNMLTKTNANYVEVIHTDVVGALSNGMADQMGHADFYPNGGGNQPGCFGNHECNQNRAWMFFAASINDNVFNANCCTTILQKDLNRCRGGIPIPMGENTLGNKIQSFYFQSCASGMYRVNTCSTYPF